MAKVLVVGGVLECSHGGKIKLTSGSAKLVVGGNAAVTSGMEAGLAFAAAEAPTPNMVAPCPIKTTSSPPLPSPCVATSPASAGASTKLFVGGTAVLLESASGQTINPMSPGTWKVSDPGQTLLESS